jgi:DHA1 family bicyclomycin/chloramphenicol resistance-like MFS transporter
MMARVTSIVMTIFILVPAIAPTMGALILRFSDWRAIFLAFVVFGLTAGAWLMLRQPETLPPERRRPLRVATLWAALREVLGNGLVRTYIAVLSLGFGQMFIFLSTAPQAFADVYGRGDTMPYWLGGVALVAGSSGILNAVLVVRLGMRRLATWAFAAQSLIAMMFMAVLMLANLGQDAEFAAFLMFLAAAFFMIGLTFGNLNALALEPMGHIAGMASAVVGALSTFGAAAIAIPVGLAYDGSAVPIVAGVILCSGLAFGLMLTTRDTPEPGPTTP